jgi:predicted nucleotidyltransferase
MDKKTLKIMKSFVKKLGRKFKIDKVILFGSRARGDNFVNSDFDIIVVSDDFEGQHFLDRIPKVLELWNFPYDLEPLCYTTKEFVKAKQSSLIKLALKEGVVFKPNKGKI